MFSKWKALFTPITRVSSIPPRLDFQPLVRSKHHVWAKRSDQSGRKEVKQNDCLTGMCAVALYWFYIQVSLRILSGACKREIGKRHCGTATSHCTGDIKGEEGQVGRAGTKRRKQRGRKEKEGESWGRAQRYWLGSYWFWSSKLFSQLYLGYTIIWLPLRHTVTRAPLLWLKPFRLCGILLLATDTITWPNFL